jgi:tetratricopeptide (TPR) repeat protein
MTGIETGGVVISAEILGFETAMIFEEDNTTRAQMTGEEDKTGAWAIADGQVIVKIDETEIILTLADGCLTIEQEGTTMIYSKEETQTSTNGAQADEEIINHGMELMEAQDYDNMLVHFDAAIAENAVVAEYHYWRGYVLRHISRYEEAEHAFATAIEIEPDNASYWDEYGFTMLYAGKYQEAYEAIDKAVTLEPSNGEYIGDRGYALFLLDRHEDALADLERAIEMAPDYENAYYFAVIIQSELGAFEEVVRLCKEFLARVPDDHYMWFLLGDAYFELGNYVEALAEYDRLIATGYYSAEDIANYAAAMELATQ